MSKRVVCRVRTCKVFTSKLTRIILLIILLQALFYGFFVKSGHYASTFQELDFLDNFTYPVNIYNLERIINRLSDGGNEDLLHDMSSRFQLNTLYSNITILAEPQISTSSDIGLLIIVKSAVHNNKRRSIIRSTWGRPHSLSKFGLRSSSSQDKLKTRLVFVLGLDSRGDIATSYPYTADTRLPADLPDELLLHDDILLGDFVDVYKNLTYKTMFAMRWAVTRVKRFKYLIYMDDDVQLDLESAVNYINGFRDMPVVQKWSECTGAPYLEPATDHTDQDVESSSKPFSNASNKKLEQRIAHFGDRPLYTGDLYVDRRPVRSTWSEYATWYTLIEEYPYNYYPPYIAGAATIFDEVAVRKLYYGSFFTKHLWVDDVYLAIVAYKVGISLLHNTLVASHIKYPCAAGLRHRDDSRNDSAYKISVLCS